MFDFTLFLTFLIPLNPIFAVCCIEQKGPLLARVWQSSVGLEAVPPPQIVTWETIKEALTVCPRFN